MDLDFNLRIFSFERRVFIGKDWIRSGIVMLAVLLSIISAYWGTSIVLILLLIMLLGIVGVYVLFKKPDLGFIAIIFGGFFVPTSGPSGVNLAVLAVALVIGIWLLNMLVVKREFRFIKSQALLPLTVMLVISVIAFGMGRVPWFVFANQAPLDAQLGGFAIFVLSLGCTMAAAHLIYNLKSLEMTVWAFIGVGAFYVFGRLASLPVGGLYHFGVTAGSMFWTWLVILAFAQAVFNTDLKLYTRVFLYSVVLVAMFVAFVWGSDWKSGWVPAVVGIAIILGLRYRQLVILAIPFAVMAVGYFALKLIASDEYSWGTRVDAWQIVFQISKVSPLFGLGFSNYYWYTPLFPIRGWAVSFNSHSQFVDLVAQVGVLGFLCFLWIFFEMGRLSWRLSQSQLPDGFSRAYVHAILAGVIATLVGAFLGDWVLPYVYNVGFHGFRASILPWMFMGGLLAIEQLFINRKKPV